MSRSVALSSSLALTILLATHAPARADGPPSHAPSCDGAPGSCDQPATGQESQEPPNREIADRTHVSIVPTGNTVRAGDYQAAVHEFVFWRLAYGLTDRLELSISLPAVPVVYNVGARLALTDRDSAIRVTVGAGVWLTVDESDDAAGQGTLTVAHQSKKTNFHASISALTPLGDNGSDLLVFGYAVGVMHKLRGKTALVAEFVRMAMRDINECYGDCHQPDYDVLNGVMLGGKVFGESTDLDLGIFIPILAPDLDAVFPPLPVVSITRQW